MCEEPSRWMTGGSGVASASCRSPSCARAERGLPRRANARAAARCVDARAAGVIGTLASSA